MLIATLAVLAMVVVVCFFAHIGTSGAVDYDPSREPDDGDSADDMEA